MKVRDDGKYQMNDGRVMTPEEVTQLHKKMPEQTTPPKKNPKVLDLKEGQSSGPVQLND